MIGGLMLVCFTVKIHRGEVMGVGKLRFNSLRAPMIPLEKIY